MKRFNTITKLIVTPALVIALSAGAAMAKPGHHSLSAHHSAAAAHQMHVTSSHSANIFGHTMATPGTVTGNFMTPTTDLSSLGSTAPQSVGAELDQDVIDDKKDTFNEKMDMMNEYEQMENMDIPAMLDMDDYLELEATTISTISSITQSLKSMASVMKKNAQSAIQDVRDTATDTDTP